MLRYAPLLIVPVALALHYLDLGAGPVWVFIAGAGSVAVLADWVRRGTEQVASHAGPAIGGLLNVSFGSVAELILALFVLMDGHVDVVRAQITGSIIGTTLLGLGLAALVGGIGRERQEFNRAAAGQLSTLLILLVIALLLPAVFSFTEDSQGSPGNAGAMAENLSLGVSAVLLFLYAANLVFTLVTHRDVFASEERGGKPEWSLKRGLGVMVGATVAIALMAEITSNALEDFAKTLGLSTVFVGVVLLALVGTASDLIASIAFASRNRMNIVLNVCVGSAVQVALVVAPLLVLLSWLLGTPMDLVFRSPLDLLAVTAAAFAVRTIAADGATTWFEGLLLVGVYAMLGLAFFFVGGS